MKYKLSCRVTSLTLSLGIKISTFLTLIFVGTPTSDWTLGLLVTLLNTWRGQSLRQAMAITASLGAIQNFLYFFAYTSTSLDKVKHVNQQAHAFICAPDICLACLTSCLTCSSNTQYLGNQ